MIQQTVRFGFLLYLLSVPPSLAAAWDGELEWARHTALTTAESGVVETVKVRAGEQVEKGATLLQLQQTSLRARITQTKALVRHAELLRTEANRELERAEELYLRTLLADRDLDVAKIAYAEADATYRRALADQLAAEDRLRQSTLIAPFAALILERRVQPAETVVQRLRAEPMLILVSATEMVASFVVAPTDIDQLAMNKKVTVACEGERYQGQIESITFERGTARVKALFSTGGRRLLPGLKAQISMP